MTLTLAEFSPHDPITVSVASSIPAYSFNRSDLASTVTLTQTAANFLTCSAQFMATSFNPNGGPLYLSWVAGTGAVNFGNGSASTVIATISTAGVYAQSSDADLKENIRTIDDALLKVKAIRGVTYNWKKDSPVQAEGEHVGVIAQEVQAVLPHAISKTKTGHLAVAYSGLVPLLIEAIKELSARLDILEKK